MLTTFSAQKYLKNYYYLKYKLSKYANFLKGTSSVFNTGFFYQKKKFSPPPGKRYSRYHQPIHPLHTV